MSKLLYLGIPIIFITAASAQMIYGPTDDPKTYQSALAHEEQWVAQHPAYKFVRSSNLDLSRKELIAAAELPNGSSNPVRRLYSLVEAAKAALETGQNEQANRFAAESLQFMQENRRRSSLPIGETIFYANLILGRVALLNGNISEAEQFLLSAGRTPGSPVLDSFGPNMSLARELLKRGRRDVVLRFFAECRSFWKASQQLDAWTAQVQNGELPVFGANLKR